MKYLISTVETYRLDTEAEADVLIEEAKSEGSLNKYSCVERFRKSKGEIIDSWYKVTLTKTFTDEKEPDRNVSVSYEG